MITNLKHQLRAHWRDSVNKVLWQTTASQYGKVIWVAPAECKLFLPSTKFKHFFKKRLRASSGLIVKQWPYEALLDIHDHPKIRYCLAHWRDGLSWEKSGAFTYMMDQINAHNGKYDDCSNVNEVAARLVNLDLVFEKTTSLGQLLTRSELEANAFRGVGGILIHIGPDGEPIFSGAGCHRMAMAILLGRPFPAQLGVVHVNGLNSPLLQ
jgi:hypothetical protein